MLLSILDIKLNYSLSVLRFRSRSGCAYYATDVVPQLRQQLRAAKFDSWVLKFYTVNLLRGTVVGAIFGHWVLFRKKTPKKRNSMRFDTDSELGPDFATLLVMQELNGSRSGKCVCDVAARIGVDERSLYDDIAFLLASDWATIIPSEEEDEFSDRLAATNSKVLNQERLTDKAATYYEFFREIDGEVVPVYFVKLSKKGKQQLKLLRNAHFAAVA